MLEGLWFPVREVCFKHGVAVPWNGHSRTFVRFRGREQFLYERDYKC